MHLPSNQRINDHRRPEAGVHPDGQRPNQRIGSRPVVINRTINNTTIVNNVRGHIAAENVRGQRWWHEEGGVRYYHYLDHAGIHWFGFFLANEYFYTRWYADHFWWQDPYWHRWCYWNEGHWWYAAGATVYIYENDNYYQYEDTTGGVVITPAPPVEAPTPDDGDAPPPVETQDKYFYSADGFRSVQITAEGRAFLYDRTQQDADGHDQLLAELVVEGVSAKATEVKFSQQQGNKLQILVVYDDGTFARFDAWGARLDGAEKIEEVVPERADVPTEARQDGALTQKIRASETFQALQAPNWQ